ncbi:MAG: RagB/SusD family nutrient uptake outer membrane protein [Carboxylicivirga sp.]|nr:RagB/SusD family nutrient uptake outer membrane protein [Carboxylicivirga sp.]
MKILKIFTLIFLMTVPFACNDYLDVVPDDVPTIDDAFTDRVQARKYLFTCYSFLPNFGSLNGNPAFYSGDEVWANASRRTSDFRNPVQIALGVQTANDPYMNFYEGSRGGVEMYKGIRVCNTFIKRVDDVEELTPFEKNTWKAEAKFLKAFYHFYLMRMYGPIPLIKENLPVGSDPEDVKIKRAPFDECVSYVSDLFDEAANELPERVTNPLEELGRVTKPIALAMKARLLVLAASPLFNGNPDYSSFTDKEGTRLFSDVDETKWKLASDACKAAIESAELAGISLYEFSDESLGQLSDYSKLKLTLRGRVTERWNSEIIWGDSRGSGATVATQRYCQAKLPDNVGSAATPVHAATFRIAKQFYTANGVPIDEDTDWRSKDIFDTRIAGEDEKLMIQRDAEIPELHFDREPRFYADLGFDRGVWLGQGILSEDSPYYVYARAGEASGKRDLHEFNVTGYFVKKLVNYKNAFSAGNNYSINSYTFPIIRLGDLYLMYAEALNEAEGPSQAVYDYLDRIRTRAGLDGVVKSWADHSVNPTKPSTKEGLRDIIRRERLIEMVFEGQRFWDLKRWKLASEYMNKPLQGWNVEGQTRQEFYTLLDLYDQKFSTRNYLWPLKTSILTVNTDLVQNPGW